MLPLLALAGIGAAGGLLKSELIDKPKEDRQRKLAAETQRYAYLTGQKANPIEEADPFGSALQYGLSGASFGQNLESQASNEALKQKQMAWFDRNKGPDASIAGQGVGQSFGAGTAAPQMGGPLQQDVNYGQGYGPQFQWGQQGWGNARKNFS